MPTLEAKRLETHTVQKSYAQVLPFQQPETVIEAGPPVPPGGIGDHRWAVVYRLETRKEPFFERFVTRPEALGRLDELVREPRVQAVTIYDSVCISVWERGQAA